MSVDAVQLRLIWPVLAAAARLPGAVGACVSEALTVTVAVLLTPAALAVNVAVCELATVLAVATKAAVVAPETTVTAAGAGSAALLLDRLTASPLPVAALVRVTVQVVVCPDNTLPGVQEIDDNCAGETRLKVKVCVTPLALAVITAV